MVNKNITIFDYFKNNINKKKYFYEIETKIKKSHQEVFDSVVNITNNNIFYKKRIIVILPNCIAFIEYMLSIIHSGGIFIPTPYFTSLNEFKKNVNFFSPSVIITDRDDIKKTFSNKYKVILLKKKKDIKKKILANHLIFKNKTTDICSIYYSSGTTGNPKAVMYTNQNMISLIKSINNDFGFNKNDKHLTLLPFGHTASINYNILPILMSGGELFISRGFTDIGVNFFNYLEKFKITYTQIVPTIVFLLNKFDIKLKRKKFNYLKFIGCGSSTLPLSSQIEFIKKYKIKISNLYGLSETGPTHLDDPRKKKWRPGTIGTPLSVNKCKIGKNNEILIKGKNLFTGYYKNKSLYKKVFEKNHWFKTGDIGTVKNKIFYFLDRSKDLIIKNGINIVPSEIEEVIYKLDFIHECCVVGIKDSIQGEDIAVYIKLKKKQKLKNIENKIKICCKDYLSNYKIPKYYFFTEKMPKTHSGKIIRKKVREILNKKFR